MNLNIGIRWSRVKTSGRLSITVLGHWGRHEWRSLQGHRLELLERLRLARCASGVGDLVYTQLDLLPESRRRLQRNAEIRRAILIAWGSALRHSWRGG